MKNKSIPLCIPFVEQKEKDAVLEAIESGWMSHGPYNKKFEELRGKKQKIGDRTDLTKDNACQGEGGLGEYIDSIKDFYETQEKNHRLLYKCLRSYL